MTFFTDFIYTVWHHIRFKKLGYSCWLLGKADRKAIRKVLKANEFEQFVGHHVTFEHGCAKKPMPKITSARILGEIVADGMQVLVVQINDTIFRKDGEVFHITWSYEKGRRSVESKRIVKEHFGKMTAMHIEINEMIPSFFEIQD